MHDLAKGLSTGVLHNGNVPVKVFFINGKRYMLHNTPTIPQTQGLKLILHHLPVRTKKRKVEWIVLIQINFFLKKADRFFLLMQPFANQYTLKRIT